MRMESILWYFILYVIHKYVYKKTFGQAWGPNKLFAGGPLKSSLRYWSWLMTLKMIKMKKVASCQNRGLNMLLLIIVGYIAECEIQYTTDLSDLGTLYYNFHVLERCLADLATPWKIFEKIRTGRRKSTTPWALSVGEIPWVSEG